MEIKPPLMTPRTCESYERAIQKIENVYKNNKSRSWVLKMLREELDKEARREGAVS